VDVDEGPHDVTSHISTASDLNILGFTVTNSESNRDFEIDYVLVDVTFTTPPANVTLLGDDSGDKFGFSLSAAGDFNDDGVGDMIIGSPGANNTRGNASMYFGRTNFNETTIFTEDFESGNLNKWTASGWTASTNAKHGGTYSAETITSSSTLTLTNSIDLSGYKDVQLDFWWTVQYLSPSAQTVALDIYDGSWNNNVMTLDASDVASGTWVNQKVDIDASFTLSSSFKIRFSSSGLVLFDYAYVDDITILNNLTANVILEGENTGDQFGYSVSGLGDVDADGIDDVIAGAPFNDDNGSDAGAIYVFSGYASMPGRISISNANYTELGQAAGERLGHSVGAARKIDKSQYYAVLAGAPYADPSSNTDIGKAYAYSLVPEYPVMVIPLILTLLVLHLSRRHRFKASVKFT
jgi:hypothetical protein